MAKRIAHYGWLVADVRGYDKAHNTVLLNVYIRRWHPGWWLMLAWYWLWRPVDEALRSLRSSD
jgi:hypothetical protein